MTAPNFITEDAVAQALTPRVLLDTVGDALAGIHQGRLLNAGKIGATLDDADHACTLHAMVGVLVRERVAGVKWVGSFNRNPERGLPRAPATILLTDTVSGTLLAVVEATSLTARRTAAAAIVAAKACLQRTPSRTAILGFGAIGRSLVPLLAAAFPPQEVAIWGGGSRRPHDEAERMAANTGLRIVVCDRPEDAARDADIVFTASGLSENKPFLTRAMVADHAVVCTMGSYQEIAADIVHASELRVVDDWAACTKRGSLAPVVREGGLDRSFVHRELPELVADGGLAGGPAPARLPVVFMLGLGALDVALARRLL